MTRFARWLTGVPSAVPRATRIPLRARAEYDGASYSRRTESWRRNGRDSNAELHPAAIQALRGIAREVVRNNAYAANAASKLAQYLVGNGIRFHVYRNGVKDKALTEQARAHFESTACDADGRHNLYGLQLLGAQTMVVSGEVLVRRRWRKKRDNLPAPFQLQVLEPDWMHMLTSLPLDNGGVRIQGVEFDAIGRRTGYWLWSKHPGSVVPVTLDVKLIDAADIAHIYRTHRPGAVHGESWFAPVIVRIKDFGEFEDAQLVRQKIAACFAAFRSGDPDGDPAAVLDSNGQPLDNDPSNFAIEPGVIEDLAPGTTVTFANPPTVGDYEPFSRVSRQAIAAGLGLPYEVMTGDLSNVSFISGRIGRLDFKQSVEAIQNTVLIPQLCEPAGRWLLDAWEMQGLDIAGVTIRWSPPRFPMMSPETEIPATRDAIRSGQQTISGAARERGEDPDDFLEELAHDFARLKELGLVLDCDPGQVTQVGNPVAALTPAQMDAKGKPTNG
jgi:lambda family phage portal protein